MKDIFYRQLGPSDYNQYETVRLNSLKQYPDNFGTTYEEESNSNLLKLSKAILKTDSTNFAFGAFNSYDALIGICGFMGETRIKTRHRGEIVQLYVDSKYQHRGIGKTLLQLCIDGAFENKNIEQITLSAVDNNFNAMKLYLQLGFIKYGSVENYFKFRQTYSAQSFLYLMRSNF